MYATRVLRMQPTRAMFRAAPVSGQVNAPTSITNTQQKEEHSAHTISQRIRQLRKIPPELIPLGVVLGVAVGAAVYSLGNKLVSDKTLRLTRSKGDH